MGEPNLDQAPAMGIRQMSRWENSTTLRTDSTGTADFSPSSFTEATVLVEADGFAPQALGWRDGAKEIGVKLKKAQEKREGK